MVNLTGTSFIPKKDFSSGGKLKKVKSVDLFFLVSIIVFLISTVSFLGIFLFKVYLNGKIDEGSIILEKERSNFDVNSIRQLSRLDQRMVSSEELLNNHVDLSEFFKVLGDNTLRNIQFKKFRFSLSEEGTDISMEGVARSYSAIVLQSDIFAEHPFINNPIFSNLDVNDQGDVVFDFSASVSSEFVFYKEQ